MFADRNMWFAGGAAQFNPLSLSPALWLSDTGSDPSVWPDISGNGRHATQANGSFQPTIATASLNGRQTRVFDGSDDFLSYPSSVFSYSGAATVYAVLKSTTPAASEFGSVISEYDAAGRSIGCQPNRFPNSEFRPCTDVFAPGGMEYGAGFSAAVPHLVSWQWANWSTHKTDGNTVIAVDGVPGIIAAYGTNPSGFSSSLRQIGKFSANPGSGCLAATIAEIVVFPTAHTPTQRGQMNAYLNAKYAIY